MPITDIKFTNNARTLLSTGSLADDDTSVSVDDGSVFPALSSGNYFYATLERAASSTTREIVKVTARSGNTLTIVRAQDNTSATTFSADDIIELRVVAKSLEDIRDAVITQEEVEDYVGGMLDGTETFISVSYDDGDGNIDFVVPVKDEDNMASDSATHLSTQQSIKAYVDDKIVQTILTLYKYTATAGQTTFTGSDDGSTTLAYTAGSLFVTLNGLTLENGTDYTATNGTSVVLTDAATVGDELNIYAFGVFNAANVTGAGGDFSIADDLSFTSDGAIINMGANSDVTITHVHDTGIQLETAADSSTNLLQLLSDDAGAGAGPYLRLKRTSGSPADNDNGGIIVMDMENDNNQQFDAVQIMAKATDVSDGTEDSQLSLATMVNGSLTTGVTVSGSGIQVPDSGKIGSVSAPSAIDINSAGEIGVGTTANASITLLAYNNETGHNALRASQDNASSTTAVFETTNDGQGYGIYSVNGNGSGIYGSASRAAAGYYVQNAAVAAHYAIYAQSTGNYGVYGRTLSTGHGGIIGYDDSAACYGIIGYSPSTTLYSLYGNGSTYVSGSHTSSDSRLKDIQSRITTSDGMLAKVNQLKPTYYKWKSNTDQGKADDTEQIGFVAQEVESIFNHLVKNAPVPDMSESPPDSDGKVEKRDKTLNEELGDTKFIAYEKLTVYLTAALQEASAKIDTLEARIKTLEDSSG